MQRRSPNLVFTSAGDRSNVRAWLRGRRDFDLWVAYYEDGPDALRDDADLYGRHKGSKFQNLHHCYQEQREIFSRNDAVLVMDDDVVINGTGITRLFEIQRYRRGEQRQPQKELGRLGRAAFGAVVGVLRYAADWTLYRARMIAARLVRSVPPAFGANKLP